MLELKDETPKIVQDAKGFYRGNREQRQRSEFLDRMTKLVANPLSYAFAVLDGLYDAHYNQRVLETEEGPWSIYRGNEEFCAVYGKGYAKTLFMGRTLDDVLVDDTAAKLSEKVLKGWPQIPLSKLGRAIAPLMTFYGSLTLMYANLVAGVIAGSIVPRIAQQPSATPLSINISHGLLGVAAAIPTLTVMIWIEYGIDSMRRNVRLAKEKNRIVLDFNPEAFDFLYGKQAETELRTRMESGEKLLN